MLCKARNSTRLLCFTGRWVIYQSRKGRLERVAMVPLVTLVVAPLRRPVRMAGDDDGISNSHVPAIVSKPPGPHVALNQEKLAG